MREYDAGAKKSHDVELKKISVIAGELALVINRFVVALRDGRRCHVHDTGSLVRVLPTGTTLYYAPAPRLGRETDCDVMAVRLGTLVLVDSRLPNELLERILRAGILPDLSGEVEREHLIRLPGLSYRADFVLLSSGRIAVVEAKGVNYTDEKGYGLFPSAKTERGSRQLDELRRLTMLNPGIRAILVFVALRDDVRAVRPFASVDREFASRLCAYRDKIEYRAVKVKAELGEGELSIRFGGEIAVEPCS